MKHFQSAATFRVLATTSMFVRCCGVGIGIRSLLPTFLLGHMSIGLAHAVQHNEPH